MYFAKVTHRFNGLEKIIALEGSCERMFSITDSKGSAKSTSDCP